MASNVKSHQRFFALTIALIFLISVVAVSVFTVMAIIDDNNRSKNEEAANNLQLENQQEGNTLKDTQLANFTPVTAPVDKLQIVDLKEGTGKTADKDSTVVAHYTGAYAVNGVIFESSKDSGQPAEFPLSAVIEGWQQGVPGMKEGGTRRLIIPGNLAYGEAPAGYTPGSGSRPMGPLVFDIELVSVK